jgi:hypothetical protein
MLLHSKGVKVPFMAKNRIGKNRVRNAKMANGRKAKRKAPLAADIPRISRFAKLRGRATVIMTAEEILTLTRGK